MDGLPPPDEVDHVVVCGMGGSGVGGDVLAACAHAGGRVPVLVHKGYGVPACAGERTLVVAASYSGETEETVDAVRAAVARGARGIALTCGGSVAGEARRAGWPVVEIAPGAVKPRFALGWMSVLPAAVCERAGLVDLAGGWHERLPERLAQRAGSVGPKRPAEDNPAKALAGELAGAVPIVWGGDGGTPAAAVRWKNDLNENAKVPAHAVALPEVNHNEIVGWGEEGREGRPAFPRALVCLRGAAEDRRLRARLSATLEEVAPDFPVTHEVRAEGAGPLEEFCDLALLGGFTSVYLAILRGVDPVSIAAIDRLKATLAEAGPPGDGGPVS